jgi:acetate kinase
MRSEILSDMENLGIFLDSTANRSVGQEGLISTSGSPVLVAVAHIDEGKIVAREIHHFLKVRAKTAEVLIR